MDNSVAFLKGVNGTTRHFILTLIYVHSLCQNQHISNSSMLHVSDAGNITLQSFVFCVEFVKHTKYYWCIGVLCVNDQYQYSI